MLHWWIAGFLNTIFSWRGFLVTTRISYAIYLTQFPIFFYNVGQIRTADHYEVLRIMVSFILKIRRKIFFYVLPVLQNYLWNCKCDINCFKYLICVSDKFKRDIVDSLHVNSSHADVWYTVSEYKKLCYVKKTNVEKGHNKIIKRRIILFHLLSWSWPNILICLQLCT